jgi:hypothetical protein
MRECKGPEHAGLLDILVDLPLPSPALAMRRFDSLVDEACRWKGEPLRRETRGDGRRAIWADLEIWQSGRGIRVLVRAPRFDGWWHDPATWADDPMGAVCPPGARR